MFVSNINFCGLANNMFFLPVKYALRTNMQTLQIDILFAATLLCRWKVYGGVLRVNTRDFNMTACHPPSLRQCRYGLLWSWLNSRLIHPKNNVLYVYGDWWFHINHFDSDKSLFLHQLATQFYVPDDVPRALRSFTTGCVKLQPPSLRRDAWRHNGGM